MWQYRRIDFTTALRVPRLQRTRNRTVGWRKGAVLLALFCLAGCADESPPPPVHIGIIQFGDSRTPQVNGFVDGMQQLGYARSETVRYTILNAHNDRNLLVGFTQQLLAAKVDMIASAGGLETDAVRLVMGETTHPVPVVVLYINAIIERGVVRTRRNPGWNVTGVDNLNAELSGKRIELLRQLLPRARRILILYTERIDPSRVGLAGARDMAAKLGLTIDARDVTTREDIARTMRALRRGDVDAMLLVPNAPIDNALKDIILPETRRLGLPVMAFSRPMAEAGAIAAYGAPFYDMGNQAARLAVKVLHGVPPQNIPFETPKRFLYTINRDVLETLDVRLSDTIASAVDEFIEESG